MFISLTYLISINVYELWMNVLYFFCRLIKQEKENLERELEEIHERNRQLNKEMKEAKSQGKLAMQEFTEINER